MDEKSKQCSSSEPDWLGLRAKIMMDPNSINLNTGSYGHTPQSVFRVAEEIRSQIAHQPMDFLIRRLPKSCIIPDLPLRIFLIVPLLPLRFSQMLRSPLMLSLTRFPGFLARKPTWPRWKSFSVIWNMDPWFGHGKGWQGSQA